MNCSKLLGRLPSHPSGKEKEAVILSGLKKRPQKGEDWEEGGKDSRLSQGLERGVNESC